MYCTLVDEPTCWYNRLWNFGTLGLGKAGSVAVYIGAAVLEVAGDALIRKGMRGSGAVVIATGVVVLGSYGVVVNLLNVDFSRLLGAYVGVFAILRQTAGIPRRLRVKLLEDIVSPIPAGQ